MYTTQTSQRTFLGLAALLFAASAAATIAACRAMAAMDDMPMPGGWTLSMMWMRMPGQTWPGVAAEFLGMWQLMMIAMMLPVLLPMLRRYRATLAGAAAARVDALTAVAAFAYFTVWLALGALVFAFGATLAALTLEQPVLSRAVPVGIGLVVLAGGVLQFSAWKQQRLACCRGACGRADVSVSARAAWRHGLHLGLDCVHCCAGPTAILLVLGMMDLRAMALVTAAICLERLAPGGARAARAFGVIGAGAGAMLLVRAVLVI
jgi:predicted metal-binding membrane protein